MIFLSALRSLLSQSLGRFEWGFRCNCGRHGTGALDCHFHASFTDVRSTHWTRYMAWISNNYIDPALLQSNPYPG